MKKTFITLTSVIALTDLASAQTNGTVINQNLVSGTTSLDYGGLTTVNITGSEMFGGGGIGSTWYGINGDTAPDSHTYNFSIGVIGLRLNFTNWDHAGEHRITFSGHNGITATNTTPFGNAGNFSKFDLLGNTLTFITPGNGGNTSESASFAVDFINPETNITYNHWFENAVETADTVVIFSSIVSVVPEPSSTALLGLGALGLLVRRKR